MKSRPVVVIGGGIAGLAAARTLAAEIVPKGGEVWLFEASDRLGGRIQTDQATLPGRAPFVIEGGPDSFLTRKAGVLRLVQAFHLEDQLIGTLGSAHGSYVYFRGRPRRLPEGLVLMVPSRPGELFRTDLLSPWGKMRALADLVMPSRKAQGDESLARFVRRRLGSEVLERIAEPLIAGIHGADPETMSLQASFPRMLEMERDHGSLIRAALAGTRVKAPPPSLAGKTLSYFMSFEAGMATLPRALAKALEDSGVHIVTGTPVTTLRRLSEGGVGVEFAGGAVKARAVVLALGARAAAGPLQTDFAALATLLGGFSARSAGTVTAAYERRDVGLPLLGHGFVIPRTEGLPLMGVTLSSEKWPHRAPDAATVVVRAFVGGTTGQVLLQKGAGAVEARVLSELRPLLRLGEGVRSLFTHTCLHPDGMPEYRLGHLERVAALEKAASEAGPIVLCGASYHGIGVPDCVESGERAARTVLGRFSEATDGARTPC